jgi:transcriptional regulator with GAF, ATPase, and Fis domain
MTSDEADDFSDAETALRSAPRVPGKDGGFNLVVAEGPDAGRRAALRGPTRLLIGSGPACELRLTDRTVSRRHAAVSMDGGRVRLVDLDSTNGTTIDDVPIRDAYLLPGHVVRLGDTALRVEPLEQAPGALPDAPPDATGFGRMIGKSLAMRALYPLCTRLAASTVPVVIEGETGTGKEVLAEALHEQGPRASRPFVVFDCTAAPPNLVESELFGHERGAFTGAVTARKGVFEQAHGGTLLIDEIGDLELSLQPKLLRAIERSEFRRVGGTQQLRVDVRVLAATRRDLDHEVQVGRFRDDLYHRLAVARIELPPLRQRQGDVAYLAGRFWSDLGGRPGELPAEVLSRWSSHPWPGNVRELRNAVARQLALGSLAAGYDDGGPRAERAAPPRAPADFLDEVLGAGLALPVGRRRVVEEYERRYVAQVLAAHGGNVGAAAAASGIARRYFQTIRARSGDR